MPSTKQMVHGIIQEAGRACANINESPEGAAESELVPIQTGMIIAIASVHGINITQDEAAELQLKFSSTSKGGLSALSHRAMVGWLPGMTGSDYGSMSASLTEAIGWTANSHFEQIAANTKA